MAILKPTTVLVQKEVVRFELEALTVDSSGLAITDQGLNLAAPQAIRRVEIKVTTQTPVRIRGRVDCRYFPNADLLIVAPAGIEFGEEAKLTLGGSFLATTGRLKKERLEFAERNPQPLVNQGVLEVAEGRTLTLIGGRIDQRGTLRAPGGVVNLAAPVKGFGFRIQSLGFENLEISSHPVELGGLSFARSPQGGNAGLLEQFGTIDVSGDQPGRVLIAAGLGFVGGVVRATSLEQGGNLALLGERLIVSGSLAADGVEGNGGTVSVATSIRTIQTAPSQISAKGGLFGSGGAITLTAGTHRSDAGVFLSGRLTATTVGQTGGEITVTGGRLDLVDARLNTTGPTGGGRIEVGAGQTGTTAVYVSPTSILSAGGVTKGSGGSIHIWSNTKTEVLGQVSVTGGPNGGDGGLIEVSGLGQVTLDGHAASAGRPGRLVLDPKNIVIDNTTGAFPQYNLVDPNTGGGGGSGISVVALSNGNLVVTKPSDNVAGTSSGAVYLYQGLTGALISTLTGSSANNMVGENGVTALSNGNFVISSINWDQTTPSVVSDVGAATWGNGTTGITGVVSAANSLVGNTSNDKVGGVVPLLSNGNYVVVSTGWDQTTPSPVTDVGAVTWGNGNTGVTGVVSAGNSLIGTSSGDQVGLNGITALSNGNYVVRSINWDQTTPAALTNVGAVTWGNGTTGVAGAVNGANSLVGSSPFDQIGRIGVTALSNGNYVVSSPNWDQITPVALSDAGAVTWGNGTSGVTGIVSSANSLVGTTSGDQVGLNGVTALSNGNYVASSSTWDQPLGFQDVGAVTWGNGTTGMTGAVSAANSLVGSGFNNLVGNGGVTALTNGNYVVSSPTWDQTTPSPMTDVGAVTWGNGTIGMTGVVSSANSLVGSRPSDFVGGGGGGVTALSNGNYVVRSPSWDQTTPAVVSNVGAVTWGNGTTGVTGVVSSANSLVGSTANDGVGAPALTALSNGNYVVHSYAWNGDRGAVTWGNGTTGVTGVVSAANSLVGTTPGDEVGLNGVTALANGNYVVHTPTWDQTTPTLATNVGAVTWGSGTSGVTGAINASNSLVGSTTNDQVGTYLTPLSNGNYVARSPFWNQTTPATAAVGAVTWGNGISGVTGFISTANSLVGSNTNELAGLFVTALSNGNYVVQVGWNGGRGAVTWVNGTDGQTLTGTNTINAQNSIIGTVVSAGLQSFSADEPVNGTFSASFTNDPASGRVTLGLSNPNPNQLTYSRWQGGTTTITVGFLTNLLNAGTAVTLQANNDITLNSPLSTTGNGTLTLQAGRSVLLNQPVTLANGDLTVIANDLLANGVVDAQRDPGAAAITATGAIVCGTGSAVFDLRAGTGKTNLTSGNLQLLAVSAGTISVSNNGTSAGSAIRVTGTLGSGACTGASLCTAGGSGGITINHPNSGANFRVGNATTNGTAGSLVTAATSVPSPTIIVNSPGTFTQGNINVTPGSACNVNITANSTPFVSGGTLTLTSTPSGGSGTYTSFAWTGPNGFTSNVQNPPPISPATVVNSGTYTVTVTDSNSCMATATTTATIQNPCVYSITPTSATAPSTGETAMLQVSTGGTCNWTASSNIGWMSITAGQSGTGDGTVTYSVLPNTGIARIGTLTVAGQTFTVTQGAGGCAFEVLPKTQELTAVGGSRNAQVAAPTGCAWTAVSNANWLTVTAGATGNGGGSVTYSVGSNTTGFQRVGTLTIAGQTLTVTQAPDERVWQSNGPGNGSFTSLTVDPTNPNVAYVGYNTGGGGIYKTLDGGLNWFAINQGFFEEVLFTLAVDPTNPTTLYAGAGILHKSTDGGYTWADASTSFFEAVNSVRVNPNNPNIIYAGTDNGFFRSTDSGSTFTDLSSGLTGGGVTIVSLALTPGNPNTIYAATAEGVFKSTTGGGNWVAVNTGLPAAFTYTVVVDPVTTSTLYAGNDTGIFRSTNGGGNWTQLGTNAVVTTIAINPQNPAVFYVGVYGDGVYKTTDGGASFAYTSTGLSNFALNLNTLAVNPSNPNIVLAASDFGGISRTTDGAVSWNAVGGGLDATIFSIAVDPTNLNIVYAGAANEATLKSTDAGTSWTLTGNQLGNSISLVIDPSNPNTLYSCQALNFRKSTNGGTTFVNVTNGLNFTNNRLWWTAIDPVSPNTLYVTSNLGVSKTTNGGTLWSDSSSGLPVGNGNQYRFVLVDAGNPNRVLVGAVGPGGGVYRSTNGGTSWTASSTGLTNTRILTLAQDPNNLQTLYAGASTEVFRSTDGGINWASVSNGLPGSEIYGIAVDPNNPNTIYAATQFDGVYLTNDGGGSWTAFNPGLANKLANVLVYPRGSSRLFAGTGSGLFYIGPNGCSTPFQLSPTNASVGASGGTGSFNLTAGAGCSWTAVPNAGWISVTNGGTGLGNGTISYLVSDNPGPARTGTITVADRLFTIRQDGGQPCAVTILANAMAFDAGAGTGTIGVSARQGCAWTAASNDAFITVTAGANGTGNGTVTYSVTANNTGVRRNGTLTVGGKTFTVTQDTAPVFGLGGPGAATPFVAALDPSNPATLYLGQYGGGMYKTVNGGAAWHQINTGFDSAYVAHIAIDRNNPTTLFTGASNGLYKSTNGGENWARSQTGLTNTNINWIEIDPVTSTILYAGTNGGFFKSTNGGANWAASNNGLTSLSIWQVVVDPLNPATVYACAGNNLHRSLNGGANWSVVPGLPTTGTMYRFAIDPRNPQTMLVGSIGNGMYKTLNGGTTWFAVNQGLGETGIQGITFDPVDPSVVYTAGCCSVGIHKSTDGGVSWAARTTGLPFPDCQLVLIDPTNPARLYTAIVEAGMFTSNDGGNTWSGINTGLGPTIFGLAGDPSNPNTVYAATNLSRVIKTTDGGATFSNLTNGFTQDSAFSIAVDPTSPTTVYAGGFGTIFKTTDGGNLWTGLSTGLLSNRNYTCLAVSSTNPATVFAGATNGMFRSTNGGANWATINTGLPANPYVYRVVLPGGGSSQLYSVINGGGVYKSTDTGSSWAAANTGFTDLNLFSLASDPTNPATLYAGGFGVVYKTTNGGVSWTPNPNGLTASIIIDLKVNPSNPNLVHAAIFNGRQMLSTDGGTSWNSDDLGVVNKFAFDQYLSPSGTSHLVGTGGGVFRRACTFGLSAGSASFNAAGGNGSVTVTSSAGCPWNITGVPSWVTGLPLLSAGTSTLTYTVAANTGPARNATLQIAGQPYSITQAGSACPTIPVNPSSLPAGQVGTAYNQTITATGGTAPYVFTITNGTLPPGLNISGTGIISGTPTLGGTFNFTVTATDSGSCTGSLAYSVTIVSSGGTLAFSVSNYPIRETAGSVAVTVTRTTNLVGTISVQYSTSDGTAHAPGDYTTTSGTLTFNPGEMVKTFTVPIINDGSGESDETVNLTLSNPTGGAVLGSPGTSLITIMDVSSTTPAITQFYPVASIPGKPLSIFGSGFVAGSTQVFFGGTRLIPATVTTVTATRIDVVIPASSSGNGNINGYLTVRTVGLPDATSQSLVYQAPDPSNPGAIFPEFVLWGDASGDGLFGTNDVALARAFLQFQAAPSLRQLLAVDVIPLNANGSRGNGQLTSTDLTFLRAVSFGQASF